MTGCGFGADAACSIAAGRQSASETVEGAKPRRGFEQRLPGREAGLLAEFQPACLRLGKVRSSAMVDNRPPFGLRRGRASRGRRHRPVPAIRSGPRRVASSAPRSGTARRCEHPAQLTHDRRLLVRSGRDAGTGRSRPRRPAAPASRRAPAGSRSRPGVRYSPAWRPPPRPGRGRGATGRCRRSGRPWCRAAPRRVGAASPQPTSRKPEPRCRIGDQRSVKRVIDVAMEDVIEVANLAVGLPALQEIALVSCLEPIRNVTHGAPPPQRSASYQIGAQVATAHSVRRCGPMTRRPLIVSRKAT